MNYGTSSSSSAVVPNFGSKNAAVIAPSVSIKEIDNGTVVNESAIEPPSPAWCCQHVASCGKEHTFVLCVVLAVFCAWIYPQLALKYLYPELTAQWIAVVVIFVCAGLNLKTSALTKALWNVPFNAVVQTFNFLVVSGVVFGVTRGLIALDLIQNPALADGMVVCASLPMAINMVVVLCHAAHGDEAAAVFNATLSNLLGVVVSPLLIPLYVGVTGNVEYRSVLVSLTLKVIVPVLVGQVLHHTVPVVHDYLKLYKRCFALVPQCCLLYIIYTVFCQTFHTAITDNEQSATTTITLGDFALVTLYQFLLMSMLLLMAWYMLGRLFPNEPKLRVMGLFGCTHKTISIGVPLIGTIYHGDPSVGMYTLPLLIWSPMQLIVGSFLAPHLSDFVAREQERLRGGVHDASDDDSCDEFLNSAEKVFAQEDQHSAEINAALTENARLLQHV
jgi:solute carrier family 10 (sodium/bile acid cotransporter), member 7